MNQVKENWNVAPVGTCFKNESLSLGSGSENNYSISFSPFSINEASGQNCIVSIKGDFKISRTRKVFQGICGYEWYTDYFTAIYSGECKKVFDVVKMLNLYISKIEDGESWHSDVVGCDGYIVRN